MKLCSIRSGSRGNAVLVWTDKTKILIDCGISGKAAENGIRDLGLVPEELDGILVTHEHTDHTSGVGVMSRRFHLPVYANQKTWCAMEADLGKIAAEHRCTFDHTESFSLGDIEVNPFSIPHDASDPVGYSFLGDDKKISLATDIGILEESLFRAVRGSQLVLLESNHDRNLLEMGRYPLPLKRRISSNRGHLSNDDAATAARLLARIGVKQILLGHLSPENNYPQLAEQTVYNSLVEAGIHPGQDFFLGIAPGDRMSPVCEA